MESVSLSEIVSAEIIFITLALQIITLILVLVRTNGIKSKVDAQIIALEKVVESFSQGFREMKDSITNTLNKVNESVIILDKTSEKIFVLSQTHYDSDIKEHALLAKEVHSLSQRIESVKERQIETLSEMRFLKKGYEAKI